MTALELQLPNWVQGLSEHSQFGCVPDFSCCFSGIETPKYEKERFVQAVKDNEQFIINMMMTTFITRLQMKYPQISQVESLRYH